MPFNPEVRLFVEETIDKALDQDPAVMSDVELKTRLEELQMLPAIDLGDVLEAFGIVEELRDRRDADDWKRAMEDDWDIAIGTVE